MTLVVDTSVAIKWYVQEAGRDRALRLFEEQDFAAPDLLLAEAANAAAKKVRRGEMDRAQARLVLPHLRKVVVMIPSAPLAEVALDVAMNLHHPAQDCFFLVAAEQLNAVLVTADEKLVKSCEGTRFEGQVRLL